MAAGSCYDAATIARAWRDFPDLAPDAPLAERQARGRERIAAMRPINDAIAAEGAGVLILIRDSRPDGPSQQMKARGLGDASHVRELGVGSQILVDLGVNEMELLTTGHRAYVGLEGYGLKVTGERQLSGYGPAERPLN